MELGSSSDVQLRRTVRNIPWLLLAVVVAIAALGVWNLASASRVAHAPVWKTQLVWMGLCSIVVAGLAIFDYRKLMALAWPVYLVLLAMLFAVLLHGKSAMGARRWLDLGPMHLQPSELMKLGVVILFARFLHQHSLSKEGFKLRELLFPAAAVGLPVALTMKQPDLGTALLILAAGGCMLLVAKVRWRGLAILASGGALAMAAAWLWLFRDYQKRRVLTFFDPEGDLLGAGYHASQSLIAVGSGLSTGKGWGQGTQTQLSFLPEQHTDFVFSVWGEEQGFLGALILVGLYLLLVLLALAIASNARESFGSWLAVGIAGMLFCQVVTNIGMVTGLLPVVGVTLPLMSYGGSSVLSCSIAIGLLVSVAVRRAPS